MARDLKGGDKDRDDLLAETPPLKAKRMSLAEQPPGGNMEGAGNYYSFYMLQLTVNIYMGMLTFIFFNNITFSLDQTNFQTGHTYNILGFG